MISNVVTNNCYSIAHIESLSTTGAYEDVILGSFPKEAPPYKSLWTPFDYQTWILLLLSIMVVSLSLYVVERIWYKMKNGGNFKNDGMYPNHVEKAKKGGLKQCTYSSSNVYVNYAGRKFTIRMVSEEILSSKKDPTFLLDYLLLHNDYSILVS